MANLNSIISKFKEEQLAKDRQDMIERSWQIKQSLDRREAFWEPVRNCLIPATIEDYKNWLGSYLILGGELTHYYDYSFQHVEGDWFCAVRNIEITAPLYGSDSINIIIPENIKAFSSDLGHIVLYLEGRPLNRSIRGSQIVPLFNNIEF